MLAGNFEIVSLHTVFNEETRRVGMHGVREELIERQAAAMGLPLVKLYLESSERHTEYEQLMQAFYKRCAAEGIQAVVFGDIFLEDLKAYREKLLGHSALKGIYPLWKNDTGTLIQEFLDAGFRTLVCAANAQHFSVDKMGETIDHALVKNFAEGVDPCGENGEFHTFVYDGPVFCRRIDFKTGAVLQKTYNYQVTGEDGVTQQLESAFWFQDLLP
jgi:uncharacterized protein (TIGR00290 family)